MSPVKLPKDNYSIVVTTTCTDPTPTNGRLATVTNNGQFLRRTFVSFACNSGFTLTGSTYSICQDDGNWNPTPPTCTQEGTKKDTIKKYDVEWLNTETVVRSVCH